MTEKEKLLDRIKAIGNKVDLLVNEKKNLYCELRDICCPFEIGDIVRCRNGAGERRVIVNITPREASPYYGLNLSKIKKNGEPYQVVGHSYFFEYPFVKSE